MSTDTDAGQLADEFGELVRQVRYLVRTRLHKISSRQTDVLDKLSERSLVAMRTYLEGRPVDPEAAARAHEWERRAWAAQDRDTAAVQAGAIAAEVHRASEAAVSASRRVPPAERPQGDGYFYHEGRIYKVATSQYGASKGHLFARKLDEQTGEWLPAQGMTSYLRETERVTAEKAIEIGRKVQASLDPSMALYGKCWICKRVLTDETSIANGKGPGPHAGMDD